MAFKRSFFRWICQIFCFCCVSLCSVLYNIFITFFQKTSVNAQPLSPPFFEEIAAHKEIQFFFSFWCLRLHFFYFFIFLLIFGYPLPTPWARLAPFWIDFGAIVGLTFPAHCAARAEILKRLRKKLRMQRSSKQLARNAKNLQRTSNKLMQRTFPKAKSQAAYSILRRDSNRNKHPAIK